MDEASQSTVDDAVAAARAALRGPWGRMGERERAEVLRRVADELERRFDDLVTAEVADTGKSIAQARTLDIPRGAANFRAFAEIVATAPTESFTTVTPTGGRALNYALRKPVGVVAVIVPWNLPLLLLTWKVAPALACGNAVVVKPSEETPASATLLAEVMAAAGVPAGVFNLVHGFGPDSAGEFLTRHPGVDAITFTGESATGSAIMRAAADGVKAVSFELGGKNAGLVFADADLDAAVAGSVRSSFTNGGQVCLCTERIYVQRPVFEEFTARLAKRAGELAYGWPTDEATANMPLISHQHRDEGARRTTSWPAPRAPRCSPVAARRAFGDARDGGAYVQPTVLTGLGPDARTNREEIFGPVVHVAPFDDRGRGVRARQRHRVRPGGDGVDPGRGRGAPGRRPARRRHRLGQHLVPARPAHPVRRGEGVRHRPRGRRALADFYSELTNVCVDLS